MLGSAVVTGATGAIGSATAGHLVAQGWRVALLGTLLQILASVGLVWLIGRWFDWSLARVVLLGFVISLSSTAVVLKLLKDRGELDSPSGRDVLMVLLAQDLAVVPMLILLSLLLRRLTGVARLTEQDLAWARVTPEQVYEAAREVNRQFYAWPAVIRRCWRFMKAFLGNLIQLHHLGCWILRAGQPLLLAACCSWASSASASTPTPIRPGTVWPSPV